LGCALAWDLRSLLLLRLIGGLGIGGSSVLGPMYIAEMAPPQCVTPYWTNRRFPQVSIRNLKQIHTATHPGATLERTSQTPNPEEARQRADLLRMLENEAEDD
jgi:hypothetical protein